MTLTVMVVNGNRFLINEQSSVCDKTCETILSEYGKDAIVEFDEVRLADVERKTLKDIIKFNKSLT